MNSINPLKQYFRRPLLSINLPSRGKYYDSSVVERTQTGELDIYPMTSIDEITVRTPDLLFNGEAVARVIKNCVPSIKDSWKINSVDLNALLIAIKIASNGQYYDVGSYCPHCGHENDFSVDLIKLMSSLTIADYDKPLVIGDLTIKFKPLSYHDVNVNNKRQFEIQKLISMIQELDEDQQKEINIGDIMQQFNQLSLDIILSTIASISTPEASVTERDYIREFLSECDKQTSEAIKDYSVALSKQNDIPDLDAVCTSEECGKSYKQRMNLNVTDFFG